MCIFRVILSVVCFVSTTKSAKVINAPYDGTYDVYAKSSGYHGDNECIIKINNGPNICQNKRGHNIVVIDPITDEYESVSFDTYYSEEEAARMVKYLRKVKMNSMIIMAIKDSSYQSNWPRSMVSEVDAYGSAGCPFTMYRRPWVLVTQKLPIVNGLTRELPDWKTCKYDNDYYASAVAEVKVNLQTYCYPPHWENHKCSEKALYSPDKEIRTPYGCYAAAGCRQLVWCDMRYSVSKNTETWRCERNGTWSGTDRCPVCKSKLGIEKKFDSENVDVLVGENKTLQFKFKTVMKLDEYFWFFTWYNKAPIDEYQPFTNKQLIYPYKRRYLESAPDSFKLFTHKAITEDVHEYTMSYPVINAKLKDNNTKINFKIYHHNNLLHHYVKVLKVKSSNATV